MKRTPLRRKTPLRQRCREGSDIVREQHPQALLVPTVRPLVRGVYAGSTTGPVPKTEPYRDPVLLEMARGRPCLLCPPGACHCTPGSVVACHSNQRRHGKAGGRKADDCFSVWGGDVRHRWLDQPIGHGGPTREEKVAAFDAAHRWQMAHWRLIAADPLEPPRFRRAAQRALDRMESTGYTEVNHA